MGDAGTSVGDLKALTLTNPSATSDIQIDANAVGRLTVRGNLSDSEITLRRKPQATRRPRLASLQVKGSFMASTLRAAGYINNITLGAIDHSLVFAGIQDSVSTLPASINDFASADAVISNFTLTGMPSNSAAPVLINSDIAAATIRRVVLPGRPSAIADIDQTLDFGFASLNRIAHYAGPPSAGHYISGADAVIGA